MVGLDTIARLGSSLYNKLDNDIQLHTNIDDCPATAKFFCPRFWFIFAAPKNAKFDGVDLVKEGIDQST